MFVRRWTMIGMYTIRRPAIRRCGKKTPTQEKPFRPANIPPWYPYRCPRPPPRPPPHQFAACPGAAPWPAGGRRVRSNHYMAGEGGCGGRVDTGRCSCSASRISNYTFDWAVPARQFLPTHRFTSHIRSSTNQSPASWSRSAPRPAARRAPFPGAAPRTTERRPTPHHPLPGRRGGGGAVAVGGAAAVVAVVASIDAVAAAAAAPPAWGAEGRRSRPRVGGRGPGGRLGALMVVVVAGGRRCGHGCGCGCCGPRARGAAAGAPAGGSRVGMVACC